MALQLATARALEAKVTGCHLRRLRRDTCDRAGGIGQPVPEHPGRHHRYSGALDLCKVIGDDGQEVPLGEQRRTRRKGLQGDGGYWQRQATDEILDADGWLKTGDIAIIR